MLSHKCINVVFMKCSLIARSGVIFDQMSRCRARFKLALRFCRQHEDQLKADACAKSLDLDDCNKFWRGVKRMSNDRATKYANCVADIIIIRR